MPERSTKKSSRIIDECYAQARSIIQEYHPVLEKCAELLLEKEKITRSEFEALFEESETEPEKVYCIPSVVRRN